MNPGAAEEELAAAAGVEGPRYREAFAAGDPEETAVWFGEAAGLVQSIEPAAFILERMAEEAVERLRRQGGATLA